MRKVLLGSAAGLAWGALLRLWMRYISTDPEFSWSGTLFIVGATTFVGAVLGVAWWRRQAGGRGWWRLGGIGILPAFGGAGIVMLPSVLLGALGLGRTTWHRWVRGGLVAAAFGSQYAFFLLVPGEGGLPSGRLPTALAWYTVMIGIEMWAVSVLFRPRLPRTAAASAKEVVIPA